MSLPNVDSGFAARNHASHINFHVPRADILLPLALQPEPRSRAAPAWLTGKSSADKLSAAGWSWGYCRAITPGLALDRGYWQVHCCELLPSNGSDAGCRSRLHGQQVYSKLAVYVVSTAGVLIS